MTAARPVHAAVDERPSTGRVVDHQLAGTMSATLTRPDLELVTDALETITPSGIRAGGRERPADVVILATGREAAEAFDADLRDALRRTIWHTGCTNW